MHEIKVCVIAFGQRGAYYLQWRDPITGRKKSRSTKIKITGKSRERTQATKAAAALEEKLRKNYSAHSRAITWENFRERYEREVSAAKALNTAGKVTTTFNMIERILNPQKLTDLNEERIGYLTTVLREEKKAEATVKSALAYTKAALRWACRMKLIAQAPAIEMPGKLAEKPKGRAICLEEFEKLLAAIPKIIDKAEHGPAWERLLRGLWLSGLRLGEALALSWDDENAIRVDLSGKRPMLNIPAGCDKSGKARLLALTPDFAELLLATPQEARTGLVFALPSRVKGALLTADRVKHLIGKLGIQAGVKVSTDRQGKVKHASAHDLRRSFAVRWSQRLLPQQLMELMRHESMSTTLTYYVGQNAERTADAVYDAFQTAQAKHLAKRDQNREPATVSPSSQTETV